MLLLGFPVFCSSLVLSRYFDILVDSMTICQKLSDLAPLRGCITVVNCVSSCTSVVSNVNHNQDAKKRLYPAYITYDTAVQLLVPLSILILILFPPVPY